MKLSFRERHLSITSFPSCELPKFTVVIGKNGAGKTHFLGAIKQGRIVVDIAPNHDTDIRQYDWTSLVPGGSANAHDSRAVLQHNANAFNIFDHQRRQQAARYTDIIKAIGLSAAKLSDLDMCASLSVQHLTEILGSVDAAESAHRQLSEAYDRAWDEAGANARNAPALKSLLAAVRKHNNWCLFTLTLEEFLDSLPPDWGQTDLFQQAFAKLFDTYRDLQLENRVRRVRQQDGDETASPMSDEELITRYGIPPWDFLNRSLREANLDFQIDQPHPFRQIQYQPKLRKVSSGALLDFGFLSSGEKIVMSFAFCLYYSQDRRQTATFPKLLLLDEVDAPLHPSMCRTFLRAITDSLVADQNVHVILATHSASTVALAPPESIYAMEAGIPGLRKVSQGEALDVLTDGVPTLSITSDGRRQVFVESRADADVYEAMYTVTKARLAMETSLEFIPVSESPSSDSGCDRVSYIVKALRSAGNKRVFGIIDWDSKNGPTESICVAIHGRRYALENCIYDPLLLSATIARDAVAKRKDICLQEGSYFSLKSLSPRDLQEVVNAVQAKVLGTSVVEEPTHDVEYLGGFSLRISSAYLATQGHRLETLIITAFPELKAKNSHTGDLMRHIARNVLADYTEYLPVEVHALFRELLLARVQ